jgi:hypothetical protein
MTVTQPSSLQASEADGEAIVLKTTATIDTLWHFYYEYI